ILDSTSAEMREGTLSVKPVLAGLAVATVCIGGAMSWFASSHPDGLEWAMFRSTGAEEFSGREDAVHRSLAGIQEKTAILPDYAFKPSSDEPESGAEPQWPAIDAGTSLSGIVGGAITLGIVAIAGFALRRRPVAT
ncbi:MAG: PDGLE domain-containing protein, partial [Candidatus Hydrogenedentales bacterium]